MSRSPSTDQTSAGAPRRAMSRAVNTFGNIIAFSYPLLALATGARALFQLVARIDILNKLGPTITAIAAACYLVAALGFMIREKWAWHMSVGILILETLGVLAVGSLSLMYPQLFEHTAWRYFGLDYGFMPLIQPFIGLVWLFWPETLRAYGIKE